MHANQRVAALDGHNHNNNRTMRVAFHWSSDSTVSAYTVNLEKLHDRLHGTRSFSAPEVGSAEAIQGRGSTAGTSTDIIYPVSKLVKGQFAQK